VEFGFKKIFFNFLAKLGGIILIGIVIFL